MTFEEMLKELLKGKKIKRNSWTEDEFIHIPRERNGVYDEEGNFYHLFKEDILSSNWEIVKENIEYFDFDKALKMMEKGECVKRKEWVDYYIWLDNATGHFYYEIFNDIHLYNLKSYDYKATDWYVIDKNDN